MRFLAAIILLAVLFASVGPALPVRAQIYQPPAMTPVTGPNCPQVSGLPTAPAVHLYGVCTYNGGRANLTVPAGLILRWRYYVPVWWWPPSQQEITALAYPGQTVATDWFEVFYATYLAYTPVPPETRTGVGLTLGFAAGWPVAGWRVQYVSGRTAYQCYVVTTEAGWLTDGIINPNDGIARHAPTPCP